MANPVDLTTLADVKAYDSSISGVSSDPLLERLITAASMFAATYCGRAFHSATYEEVYEGTGTYRLLLRNSPVTAVSAVSVNGHAWTLTTLGTQPGYQFDKDGLYATGCYAFPRAVRNVIVSYTAGYTTIPFDLAQAVIELVVLKYRRRDKLDIQARMIAQETISYNSNDMTKSTKAVFDKYVMVAPV